MRIKTAKISEPNKFVTCPGSDVHILYQAKLVHGDVVLIENGTESISEKINAQKEFTDMDYIRSRIAAGDTTYIKDAGVYADVTRLPKTLAESLQIRIDAEHAFYEMPLNVRNKFNNNFNLWLSEADSNVKEWNEKMGFNLKDAVDIEPIVKENVVDEQKQ